MSERPDTLTGTTHRIDATLPNGDEIRLYITINSIDTGTEFKPWEVFCNCKDSAYWEHLVAVTLLVSKLLQLGNSAEDVAHTLMGIHSPRTGHLAKGKGWVPSLYARIGQVLLDEVKTGPKGLTMVSTGEDDSHA